MINLSLCGITNKSVQTTRYQYNQFECIHCIVLQRYTSLAENTNQQNDSEIVMEIESGFRGFAKFMALWLFGYVVEETVLTHH